MVSAKLSSSKKSTKYDSTRVAKLIKNVVGDPIFFVGMLSTINILRIQYKYQKDAQPSTLTQYIINIMKRSTIFTFIISNVQKNAKSVLTCK